MGLSHQPKKIVNELSSRIDSSISLGADFSLRRERFWHQWAMAFSTASEREAGDPDFDRAVFLASDDPRIARAFRKSPEARRIAKEMLLSKCPSIECHQSLLYIQLSTGNLHGEKLVQFIADARHRWTTLLQQLASALLAAEPDLAQYRPEPTFGIASRLKILLGLATLFYTTLLSWFLLSGKNQSVDWAIAPLPWMGYWGLFLLQTFTICTMATFTHRHSVRLPIALGKSLVFSLFFATSLTPILLHVINAKLPSSEPVASYISRTSAIEVKVKRRYSTRFVIEAPPEKVLNIAGIASQDFAWKNNFDAHSSWTEEMSRSEKAQVWIQKGFLGLPLVRAIEPCPTDKTCPTQP